MHVFSGEFRCSGGARAGPHLSGRARTVPIRAHMGAYGPNVGPYAPILGPYGPILGPILSLYVLRSCEN